MSSDPPTQASETATDYHSASPRAGGIEAGTRALLETLHRAAAGPYDAVAAGMLWGLDREIAGRRLRMLAERGWLTRARHGLYWPVPLDGGSASTWTDDPWLLANRLYPTGYIGGWSACEHWSLTDQVFRDLMVFTPDRSAPRRATSGVTPIRVKVVRPDKIFGTRIAWRRSTPVRVSDPTRTVVDLLDEPWTGGGIRHVAEAIAAYAASEHCDEALLVAYVERLGNRTVFKRLGYISETLGVGSPDLAAACRARISSGVSLLDPSASANGPVTTKWNLRINVGIGA